MHASDWLEARQDAAKGGETSWTPTVQVLTDESLLATSRFIIIIFPKLTLQEQIPL
jgi:hypothetical protein